MNILTYISTNIYSLIISILILITESHGFKQKILQDKVFKAIVCLNILLISFDTFGWLTNSHSGFRTLNFIITTIKCIMAPMPLILWCVYTDYQIFQNERRLRRLITIGSIPMLINTLALILNSFNGYIFYFDSNNLYHRGPTFTILSITCYIYSFYSFILVIMNRHRMEKYKFTPMLIFPIPTIVGGVLQNLFLGLSTIWIGSTISILILFFSIQNSRLNTDYVTGLYNRRQLDNYLKGKINNSNGAMFAGIMIDLDKFKLINDTYGHQIGDEALVVLSKLLKKCFTKNDFISRYAGDEFVIILDIKKTKHLSDSIERLNNILKSYNKNSSKPYKLSLSLGHAIYDSKLNMSSDHFIKHLDSLMYKEKKQKKLSEPSF